MEARRRSLIPLVVGLGLALAASNGVTQGDRESLEDDLRTVIILAGYPCRTVVHYSAPQADEYHVTCDADRHYGVRISEETGVRVRNRSAPDDPGAGAGAGHDAFMKRELFAIVNLAGHECDRVLSYTHVGSRDSLVTCDNQAVYRIHVTAEGRVAVDRKAIDK